MYSLYMYNIGKMVFRILSKQKFHIKRFWCINCFVIAAAIFACVTNIIYIQLKRGNLICNFIMAYPFGYGIKSSRNLK